MIVASYVFAIITLVKTALAIITVAHEAMGFDLSNVTGLVQEADLKLAEPRLANFLDVSCQCSYTSEGSWTQLLQFNAIVFGNFQTFGSQDILGRLAVGGNLIAPGYVVNSNAGQQCYGTNTVPWSQLALAVGGNILSPTTSVHGHWWTAGLGTAVELNAGCNSPANVDQPFPFSAIQTLLNGYSQAYASMAPNLVLNDDNSITDLGTLPSGCYNVMTLRPCHSSNSNNCISQSNWSFSDHILLGQPNWNGPSNGYPNPNRLLVINVPVFNGETITINTNQPSAGANNCNLIWNFYPADMNGNYLSTGSFKILRNTGNPFQGVTLAPSGNILDNSQGLFQGVLFANSYQWNQQNGVEIHNTPSCNNYGFCAPPGQPSSPQGSAPANTSNSVSALTTTQVSSQSSAQTSTSAPFTMPASSPGAPGNAPPASSPTPVSSLSSAQTTTSVPSTTSVSSLSSAQTTTSVSSTTPVSSQSSAQTTTSMSTTTPVSTQSSAQTTTSAPTTTPASSSSSPQNSPPPSSVTTESSMTSAESTTTSLPSTSSESSSTFSESSTAAPSSTSATSISNVGSSITLISSTGSTHISSSTPVTTIGTVPSSSIVVSSTTRSGSPARAPLQIPTSILTSAIMASSPIPSSTSLVSTFATPSGDNCRRHYHHHKHDESEKYDHKDHAWSKEKEHEHKGHHEFDDDWEHDKHEHEDHQPQSEDWNTDKHDYKDRQENNDNVNENKYKHEENHENSESWDNDKHKHGDSEDEGYWEEECDYDTHHYHDDDNKKYKDE